MLKEDFRGIPILNNFAGEELDQLLQYARQVDYKPGNIIFRQGDRSAELYFVVRGKVRFEYEVPEGGSNLLSSVTDGMLFGEVAFLQSLPRTATAIAEEVTALIVFEQEQLQKLIDKHPHMSSVFYRALALELAKRLRENVPRIL